MEEPKPEMEEGSKDESKEKVEVRSKVLHLLSVVTIEPVVFLYFLSFATTLMSQSQMIVYKTCRGIIVKMFDVKCSIFSFFKRRSLI